MRPSGHSETRKYVFFHTIDWMNEWTFYDSNKSYLPATYFTVPTNVPNQGTPPLNKNP